MKVGDKVKGFEFNKDIPPHFTDEMRGYVGLVGEVYKIDKHLNIINIVFKDGTSWNYPLDIAETKQIWQPKQGEMIEVSYHKDVEFSEREFLCMDNGRYVCKSSEDYYLSWLLARPINPIQRQIEELEEQIKELKAKLQ